MLLEGMSVRAASRLTGVPKGTILSLLAFAGSKCQRLIDSSIRQARPRYVQLDELWTFVDTKRKTCP
jgi:hypothetical protein